MPIKIVIGEIKKEIDGSVFILRSPSPWRRVMLMDRHQDGGKLNGFAYAGALLEEALVGWENVVDRATGAPVAFDKALVCALPIDTMTALMDLVNEEASPHDPLAERSGASLPPSSDAPSGKPPTEG
jgi:hypothetical protein